MNPLEAAGTLLGLANLWLTRQQNILCWPVGIACVICYAFVFYEARLYSDLLLQLVYIALQTYGWWHWARAPHRQLTSTSSITRLDARAWLLWLGVAAASAVTLGTLMARYTGADLPWFDASATALSLVAQFLQARKVLDSWLIFILGNLIFIGVYVFKGLYLTTGLFVVSTLLAVLGWRAWRAHPLLK
jgi:nicotinamide mononucleotide transporter